MNNSSIIITIIVIIVLATIGYLGYTNPNKDGLQDNQGNNMDTQEDFGKTTQVTLQTTMGDIELELFIEKTPITAGNFIKLAGDGFYNETKFHRVINGFMIQGGDPNSKSDDASTYGTGGPGYAIEDEFVDDISNVIGTISMANSGPNTGGSQFFINVADNTFLDGKHTVFGRVISGMDVVNEIVETPTGANDLPVDAIVIKNIAVGSVESGE